MKKNFNVCLMLLMCLAVFASCGSDNSSELSAELESLRAENEELKHQATETTTEAITTTVSETVTISETEKRTEELSTELESRRTGNDELKQQATESTAQTTIVTTKATTQTKTETVTTTATKPITTSKTEKNTKSVWKLKYAVDDFKRQTDECYLFGLFYGTFDNLAATNSNLIATLDVERYTYDGEVTDAVGIQLFEYDDILVTNFYSKGIYYDIQILEEDDNIITESGYMGSNGQTIYVWGDKNQNSIVNALKRNEKLTFRIDDEDGMSTYWFYVDCNGFKELFESTDWNWEI